MSIEFLLFFGTLYWFWGLYMNRFLQGPDIPPPTVTFQL